MTDVTILRDCLRWRLATAEELSVALRQVAAHETHIATLTAMINEMRDHLQQAGVRLHGGGSARRCERRCARKTHSRQGYGAWELQRVRIAWSSQTASSSCRTSCALEIMSTQETSWSQRCARGHTRATKPRTARRTWDLLMTYYFSPRRWKGYVKCYVSSRPALRQ